MVSASSRDARAERSVEHLSRSVALIVASRTEIKKLLLKRILSLARTRRGLVRSPCDFKSAADKTAEARRKENLPKVIDDESNADQK